jgi:hypothetical protein
MDTATFLVQLGEVLSRNATTSRELEAIEVEADGRDVSMRVRRELHGNSYPPLPVILREIGRSCSAQGVAVAQLRRISFLPDEVRVELAGGTGQPGKVYRFPIEATLGAPIPVAPLRVVSGALGSSMAPPMNTDARAPERTRD